MEAGPDQAPVDLWAIGVISWALLTGLPKWGDAERVEDWFKLITQVIGPVTEENWPGHTKLAAWKKLEGIAQAPDAMLLARAANSVDPIDAFVVRYCTTCK